MSDARDLQGSGSSNALGPSNAPLNQAALNRAYYAHLGRMSVEPGARARAQRRGEANRASQSAPVRRPTRALCDNLDLIDRGGDVSELEARLRENFGLLG